MSEVKGSSNEWNTPWRAACFAVYDTSGTLVAHTGITGNRTVPGEQLERMATMIAEAVNAYSTNEPQREHPPALMAVVDKWQENANLRRSLVAKRGPNEALHRSDADLIEEILRDVRGCSSCSRGATECLVASSEGERSPEQHGRDSGLRSAEVPCSLPVNSAQPPEAGEGEIHPSTRDQQAGLLNPIEQVWFRAGLLACRAYMAAFVESGGDKIIADSIRANWWPSLGEDPGPPRQNTFQELTVGEYGEPGFRVKGRTEVSPSIEALPVALGFLQGHCGWPVPHYSTNISEQS